MTAAGFCRIDHQLDDAESHGVLKWIRGESASRADFRREFYTEKLQNGGLRWLLAHCNDGVTWGRWSPDKNRWETASEVFPEFVPEIGEHNLLELRIFGNDGELLIWRTAQGFRGRYLQDAAGDGRILSPIDEERLLVGDRIKEEPRKGFTRVGSPSGSEQIVPCLLEEGDFKREPWPLRLQVRHYLQEDPKTGVVRVAITRLVNLNLKGVGPCRVI